MHAGFCLCTPYLPGPRSTYIVAVPIAARRKTDYVGCEAFMYVVAVHRVGNSHRLCGEWVSVRRAGWDDGGDSLLAGTGLVRQQMRRGWEDAAPSCLPLDSFDTMGLGTCRRR